MYHHILRYYCQHIEQIFFRGHRLGYHRIDHHRTVILRPIVIRHRSHRRTQTMAKAKTTTTMITMATMKHRKVPYLLLFKLAIR
jgi:hypothetical protein